MVSNGFCCADCLKFSPLVARFFQAICWRSASALQPAGLDTCELNRFHIRILFAQKDDTDALDTRLQDNITIWIELCARHADDVRHGGPHLAERFIRRAMALGVRPSDSEYVDKGRAMEVIMHNGCDAVMLYLYNSLGVTATGLLDCRRWFMKQKKSSWG